MKPDEVPEPEPEPATPVELTKSGSRLKVRVVTTSDGLRWSPKRIDQWFDSQRQTYCTWQKAGPDGAFYCVGTGLDKIPNAEPGYYVDANCTEGIAYVTPSGNPDAILVKRGIACGELPRYFAPGATITSTPYHRDIAGRCTQQAFSSNTAHNYRLPGVEMPPGAFVRGTSRPRLPGSGIEVHFIEGEDGSEAFQHVTDTVHGTECSVRLAGDLKPRCLPSGDQTALGVHRNWSDSACTQPAFKAACAPARFGLTHAVDACRDTVSAYSVKEEIGVVYSSGISGTCEGHYTSSTYNPPYFSGETELPAETWPEAKPVDMATYGRLTVRGMEFGGSARIPTGLFDNQLGVDCEFMSDTFETRHCFPVTPFFVANAFSDSRCTQALAPHNGAPICGEHRYAIYYAPPPFGGPVYYSLHPLGPKHVGPVYSIRRLHMQGSSPFCIQMMHPEHPAYWTIGEAIPTSMMVEGTPGLD
ncbi:hypothetical protein HUW62_04125 [Myxococcus sp. AM011]|uniref:DUF7481 family protein n=1 Tax=Myxococcus sp. AM011 TaxID=2745200 RepID=UPI0015955B51|nr:hypothetical protein [Myxococcus sp. AM011]NVJ20407.1 hypothetical protein [Myxococcus sp. AM011]